MKGHSTSWAHSVPPRLRPRLSLHSTISHRWKIISVWRWTFMPEREMGLVFSPNCCGQSFMAVQDPHFCCHKPNRPLRPAHFHIRFPAIDSCVERVAQECRWMRHLLSFIFSDTVQSGALRVSWTHEQMVLSGLEDYTEGKDNLQERVLNFLPS